MFSSNDLFHVSEYLKPIAEEERRVEEAEKKIREEQERVYKQLSEGNMSAFLTCFHKRQRKFHL